MTNRQKTNIKKVASFANNIGKLKVGLSTQFHRVNADGTTTNYGKVTCTTKGVRPRRFMVSGSSIIPNGTDYKYTTLMTNLEKFIF